ncbi:MAG TPA: UPF0182 family protein [Bryobacteraceae bacterium]|nr:UPF0182 family protein [Bryobacteraceae bacterium]
MPGPVIDVEMDDHGGRQHRVGRIGCGGIFAALFVLFILAKSIASTLLDYEWWKEVGQVETWWQQIYVHTAPIFYATVFGYVVLWVIHARALKAAGTSLSRHPAYARLASIVLIPVSWVLAAMQFSSWDIATYLGSRGAGPTSSWRDPIFGQPLEFYFFELPVYRNLAGYLFLLLAISTVGYWLVSRLWSLRGRFTGSQIMIDWQDLTTGDLSGARFLGGATLLALAAREWLSRYAVLYEEHPFLTGADYVAANLTIPLTVVWSLLLVLAAVLVIAGRARLALGVLLFVPVRAFLPGIVNSVHVRPNEITLQKPFIEHHMRATRDAYNLHPANLKELEAKVTPTGKIDVAANRPLLDNVRLWDWQAFHDTVTQIQPLRPYTYVDTDIDRYRIGGKLRQVLLAPRELEIQQLGEARNRWPNRHVIYTHGYGVVAADANRITPNGLPSLFIQDAPPKVTAPGLSLTRPEIYYGEVAHEPVFVRTSQPEFNYPSGSDNVHSRYEGNGGFPIQSLWMRTIAAVAYNDWNIILTSYLQSDSRMMIRRRVKDRIETLAPFLHWDGDPYLVLRSDGKLSWILNGYSTSDRHPYAESIFLREFGSINYVRNSVKATVDAYTGEIKLYNFEPNDPLIRAYSNLFPTLFQDRAAMPADLREHVRYPEWMFQLQADVLLTFHMNDADAFYNKVDVWDVARRSKGRGENSKTPLDPNYVVAVLPKEAGGNGEPEFLLMLPFTPRGKDNLIGLLIARCDGENLGQMTLMELPKEELFFGPMQIESRINQDQNISKDLTLWNSQGSQVLHGQMTVLPVDNTFLFVQPIYLQAAQARMPQLKKVVLAYGNELIYTDTYEQALAQLSGAQPPPVEDAKTTPDVSRPPDANPRIQQLRQLMDRYRRAAQQGQWSEAGKALESLEAELRKE